MGLDTLLLPDQYVKLRLEVLRTETLPNVSRSIAQLLTDWGMAKEPQECLWVIATDANNNIRTVTEVARGGHADMTVEIQPVLTAVLAIGAIQFTVVHNHPTMNATPSAQDWSMTQTLVTAANACGLVVHDHLIVTPTGAFYSFADAGLILPPARPIGGKPMTKAASRRKR